MTAKVRPKRDYLLGFTLIFSVFLAGRIISEGEKEDLEAYKELQDGVSNNPHDHLDVTFEEEKKLIDEYLALTLVHL